MTSLSEEFHAKRDGDGDAGDARLRDEDVPEDGAIAVVGDVTPEGCRSAQGKPLRGIDLVRRAVHDFRDGTTVLVEHVAGVRPGAMLDVILAAHHHALGEPSDARAVQGKDPTGRRGGFGKGLGTLRVMGRLDIDETGEEEVVSERRGGGG